AEPRLELPSTDDGGMCHVVIVTTSRGRANRRVPTAVTNPCLRWSAQQTHFPRPPLHSLRSRQLHMPPSYAALALLAAVSAAAVPTRALSQPRLPDVTVRAPLVVQGHVVDQARNPLGGAQLSVEGT